MADVVTPDLRSRMMATIKSKNSAPEIKVRKILHAAGFRFRLHRRDLVGCPDIVLSKHHVVIFVHGCFWHAHTHCKFAKTPNTRRDFWENKLQKNIERDQRSVKLLQEQRWRVLYVWECSIRDQKNPIDLTREIGSFINSEQSFREIRSSES